MEETELMSTIGEFISQNEVVLLYWATLILGGGLAGWCMGMIANEGLSKPPDRIVTKMTTLGFETGILATLVINSFS